MTDPENNMIINTTLTCLMSKLKFITLLFAAAVFAASCEKDSEEPTVVPDDPGTEVEPDEPAVEGTVLGNVTGAEATASYSVIDVTWNAVDGAAGYRVTHNSTSDDVTENAFTLTDVDPNTTVEFSIIALSEAGDEYNSPEPCTVSASTLNAFIYKTTTSTIVLEIEQDGSDSYYMFSIENEDGSKGKTFTYDFDDSSYSDSNGYGDGMPLRYVFYFIGDIWEDAYLNHGETYYVKVKNMTSAKPWSNRIPATVKTHEARAGEILYEDFDRFPGTDGVALAAGSKGSTKVTDDYTRDQMFNTYKTYYWHNGGGAISTTSGSYADPYRTGFFMEDGWETGILNTDDGDTDTHNSFAGCLRIGGNNKYQSYIATPQLSGYLPEGTETVNLNVTFKTCCNITYSESGAGSNYEEISGNWIRDISVAGRVYILKANGKTKSAIDAFDIWAGSESPDDIAWKDISIDIDDVSPTDRIVFTQAKKKYTRYYIDEISIAIRQD